MIAVAKGLLAGLETPVATATKKDGTTPPFADTFRQVSSDRGDRATRVVPQRSVKTDRTASGGKKVGEPSAADAAKQAVSEGGEEPSSVGKADGNKPVGSGGGISSGDMEVAEEKSTAAAAFEPTGFADDTERQAGAGAKAQVVVVAGQASANSSLAHVVDGEAGDVAHPLPAASEGKGDLSQNAETLAAGGIEQAAVEAEMDKAGASWTGVATSVVGVAGESSAISSSRPISQKVDEGGSSSRNSLRRVDVSFGSQQAVAQPDPETGSMASTAAGENSSDTAQGVVSHNAGGSEISEQTSTPLLRASAVTNGPVVSAAVPARTARTNAPSVAAQTVKSTSDAAASTAIDSASDKDGPNAGGLGSTVSPSAAPSGLGGIDLAAQLVPQPVVAKIEPSEIVRAPTPQMVQAVSPSVAPAHGTSIGSTRQRPDTTKASQVRKGNVEVANKPSEGTPMSLQVATPAPEAVATPSIADAGGALAATAVAPSVSGLSADTAAYPTSSSPSAASGILSGRVLASGAVQTQVSKASVMSGEAKTSAASLNGGGYVTSFVAESGLGQRAVKAAAQGGAPAGIAQEQQSEAGAETFSAAVDAASSARNNKAAIVGADETLRNETVVAAAQSLVKSGQQSGDVNGGAPIAKERRGTAPVAGSAAGTASSVPVASGHASSLAGSSVPASTSVSVGANDHHQTSVSGVQAAAVPAGTVESAGLAVQSQVAAGSGAPVAAHAASGPVSADAYAQATSAASQSASLGADHVLLPTAHTTLSATPTVLEIGVPGGTQGWLKIRAEIGEGGVVQASMSASTHAGQDALRRDLPAIAAFLESEHVPVSLQVTHGTSSGSLADASGLVNDGGFHPGSSLGQSLHQNSNSSAGSGQGDASPGTLAGGESNGRNGGQQRESMGFTSDSETGSASTRSIAGVANSDWSAPVGYGSGSTGNGGGWLNVIA